MTAVATRRPQWTGVAPVLGICAAAVWLAGVRPVDPATLDGLGLLPALSPWVIAAYPLLVAAMVAELARASPRTGTLTALTGLAVFAVYGLQPVVEPVARMPVAWLHAGFADHIAEHGEVLLGFDARFSWPGFFDLVAFITTASGGQDAAVLLRWAPVVLAGLAVLGVRALAVAVLGNGRASWLAPWVFLFANWTEQDYFSPQATSYLLLLAALVLTVRYLLGTPLTGRPPTSRDFLPVPPNTVADRVRAQLLVVLLVVALAPTHQLTPYVLAGFLAVLWKTRRLWPGWLPVLALLAPLTWFVLGGQDFWAGRAEGILASVGDLVTSLRRGLVDRVTGDAQHQVTVWIRMGMTGAVGLLAAVGWYAARLRGRNGSALLGLAALPFGLMALQAYGGEMLIRCYLFALPFLAMAAAIGGDALLRAGRVAGVCVVTLVLSALGLATVAARGGNDAYVALTRQEVAATELAYRLARPGERVLALANQSPLKSGRLDEVDQDAVLGHCRPGEDVAACVRRRDPDFLVVGPAQDAYGRIFLDHPAGWSRDVVRRLRPDYEVVFDVDGAQVAVRRSR